MKKQNRYKKEIDRYLGSNTTLRNSKIRQLELNLKNKLEELQEKDKTNSQIKSIKKYLIELDKVKDLSYYFPNPE